MKITTLFGGYFTQPIISRLNVNTLVSGMEHIMHRSEETVLSMIKPQVKQFFNYNITRSWEFDLISAFTCLKNYEDLTSSVCIKYLEQSPRKMKKVP